jgi:hypothetical protein
MREEDSFIYPFIHPSIRPSVRPSVRPFVRSFIHSFVPTRMLDEQHRFLTLSQKRLVRFIE